MSQLNDLFFCYFISISNYIHRMREPACLFQSLPLIKRSTWMKQQPQQYIGKLIFTIILEYIKVQVEHKSSIHNQLDQGPIPMHIYLYVICTVGIIPPRHSFNKTIRSPFLNILGIANLWKTPLKLIIIKQNKN